MPDDDWALGQNEVDVRNEGRRAANRTDQLALGPGDVVFEPGPDAVPREPEPEPVAPVVLEHRVRALAGVLAGFRWPDRGTFEKLKVGQQRAALAAARTALEGLAREPD